MQRKTAPLLASARGKGSLIIIGGREDRTGEMAILAEVASRVKNGKLCIATVASTIGDELWEDYRRAFRLLGIKKISHLDVVRRRESVDLNALKAVTDAACIFFSGGDQVRITSELGGTKVAEEINRIFENGGTIAGTSAGASVMGETMMVGGSSDASYRIGSPLIMAPGLGFVKNMIIDQHFAERGRIARLTGAIAHNPKFLGVGIDENTAIVMDKLTHFKVIGKGAVYALDACEATGCNISEASTDSALSLFNVKFHLLSSGDEFDLATRTAKSGSKGR